MKRFTIILFLLCYLAATFGVATHRHYCGGNLTATYVCKLFSKVCGCASEKEMQKCCKETISFKKIDDSQHHQAHSILKSKLELMGILYWEREELILLSHSQSHIPFHVHAPPAPYTPPLYLLHQQFLI